MLEVYAIKALKKQAGGDIIAYGGGNFVSDLIKHNLIDEYHLFINPTAIGNGMTIFKSLETYVCCLKQLLNSYNNYYLNCVIIL